MADDGASKQDARITALWEALDRRRKGKLDFEDLRAGLRNTDHRKALWAHCEDQWSLIDRCVALKDAANLLNDLFRKVDLDGDGTIYFNGTLNMLHIRSYLRH